MNIASDWDAISKPATASDWDAISVPERRKQPRAAGPAQIERDYSADAGMSGWEKALVGAGSSVDKAIRGVTGLFGADTSQADEDAALYQKHRPKGWQTTAGEIAGDIGVQAPLALIPGGALAQIGIQGAGAAAMTPGDLKERALAGAAGAGGAAAGQVLTKTLGRLAKPVGDKPADILALEARGVKPTFGQTMGAKEGAIPKSLGRMEEAAQSVPLGGGPLRRTREATLDQWRQGVRNAALPPGAAKGAKTVDDVIEATSKAYDDVLTKHTLPYSSVTYQPDMRKLTSGIAISKEGREMVEETFQQLRLNHMQNPTPGVQATAVGAQQVESELKKKAFNFMNSQDPSQREIGQAFKKLAEDYGQTWRGALPRADQAAIKAIDRGYGKRLAISRAASQGGVKSSKGIPDNFSPTTLLQSSRATDRIPGKRNFIRGDAPLQEEGRLGLRLTGEVADSGTPERALSMAVLGGLGDVGNLSMLGLPALYGTRAFQQYATGRAMPKTQEAILRALRAAAPMGGAAGAGTVDALYNPEDH